MTFKKIIGKIHLLLGLTSGLIVFVVGLTGCLIVFEKEISIITSYGVFQRIEKQNQPLALPSRIFSVADSVLKDKVIKQAYYTAFLNEPNVNILWARDSSRQYHAVLQNPYTGNIAGTYNYKTSFFAIATYIHTSLGLGTIGSTIIGYATLVFIIMMITGIILWKPASRKGYKQRFTIKWNATFKRLNYDLHNVLGFYMTWIAIFIAITGLVWSFKWVDQSLQWMANGGKTIPFKEKKISSDTTKIALQEGLGNFPPVDRIFLKLMENSQNTNAITIYKPNTSTDAIRIAVETIEGSSYARADMHYYDQYTGKLLYLERFTDYSNGEKLRRMNYYIHMGSIGGLPGKMLAFFASLLATSLPVTGFMIWRGRKRTQKRRT